MLVVGITGGIGSGKTALTTELAHLGATIVDADIVAREVVKPGEAALNDIAAHFGPRVLTTTGELNRAALRKEVFSNPTERKWLEERLHPIIRKRIIDQLNNAQSHYAVLSSPLLLETDQHQLTDHIVVVDVSLDTQIERTTQRDSNTEAQVKAIIKAQMPRDQKIAKADTLIDNNADLDTLKRKAVALHSKLLALAKQA